MKICQVKNLCKNYPSFSLKDISFSLESGTITGFIGRNGAGKTTTIKSMLNFSHPSSGEIYYFGKPIAGNENEIKQRIGFSTGAVNYYPKKKICDIADVTRSFYKNWDDGEYKKYLNLFYLDPNKSPSQLSEGMRVKCNLLFALSHHAEMLILDEPTSGLDPFSRDEILQIFKTLKQNGVAIFFSTHITSDLETCADNIIYIQNGKIVLSDTKDNFHNRLGNVGESLEQTMIRLEREAQNGKTSI